MTARPLMAHIRLLLLVVGLSGCAAPPESRGQHPARTVPRGEYATLRHSDSFGIFVRFAELSKVEDTPPPWLELEIRYQGGSYTVLFAYDDKLVCMRNWKPWAHGGYVLFEPGTNSPTSYAGDFGMCVTEPPVSKRHRSVDELTCNFSDEHSVRVHGFAWPNEVESEAEALALSRKRAEAIEMRLGSTALPDRLVSIEAHGTERTRVSGEQGPDVIGAYFEIRPSSADDPPVTPQFFANVTDEPPEATRGDVEALLASSGIRGVPAGSLRPYDDPGYEVVQDADGNYRSVYRPYIKLSYWPEGIDSRDDATVYMAAWDHDEFRDVDIVEWAEQIIDDECGISEATFRPEGRSERAGEEK